MVKYVLGLDLGPTSIGWAAIAIDENGNFLGFLKISDSKDGLHWIPAINSRIFPMPYVEKTYCAGNKETTRNKNRRDARGAKRRYQRRSQRLNETYCFLHERNILPERNEYEKLLSLDPFEIRAKALEERIDLHHVGRAIMHIAKRRGFKSNSKLGGLIDVDTDNKRKKKDKSKITLLNTYEGKTIGQICYEKHKDDICTAVRNKGEMNIWQRKDYIDEVCRIWKCQQQYYPTILTDDVLEDLVSEDGSKWLLFSQHSYKLSARKQRKYIGKCSLWKEKLRCDKSKRVAQEFVLLQTINYLEIYDSYGSKIECGVSKEDKQKILEYISSFEKGKKYSQIKKHLGYPEDWRFNFEDVEEDNSLPGIAVDDLIRVIFGERKGNKYVQIVDYSDREAVWEIVLLYIDEEISYNELRKQMVKFDVEVPDEDILNAKLSKAKVPDGHVKYCEEIVKILNAEMLKGINLHEAKQRVCKRLGLKNNSRVLSKLPIPDRAHGFETTNPNVKVVLHEVRKIVNQLIKEFGKPERIMIECGRSIKANKKQREVIKKKQKDNNTLKKSVREIFDVNDQIPAFIKCNKPGWAIKRYILWQQQKGMCPYLDSSKKQIPLSKLFSSEVEIDHIIPREISFDNSLNNQVVCYTNENRNKGLNTPISWLKETNPEKWVNTQNAIKHWKELTKREKITIDGEEITLEPNRNKWERFFVNNKDVHNKYSPKNLLNDNSYIANEVKKYLLRLYPSENQQGRQNVDTTKGMITSELRKIWGVNSILRKDDIDQKNRGDHRHHAIDAAICAVTTHSEIQKITRELQQAFPETDYGKIKISKPWSGFERDLKEVIDSINVSHRPRRQVRGSLHGDSFWAKDSNGKFVQRKKVKDANVSTVCDEKVRDLIKKWKESNQSEYPMLPNNNHNVNNGEPIPVKKVKCYSGKNENQFIEIRPGKYVEKPENHHVELFELEENGSTQIIAKIWNTYEVSKRIANANRKYNKLAKSGEKLNMTNCIVIREHPEYSEATFKFSFSKGDIIQMDSKKGGRAYYRAVSIGENDYWFWELHIASNEKPKADDLDGHRLRSPNKFLELNAKKVTVAPLGRVRWAND